MRVQVQCASKDADLGQLCERAWGFEALQREGIFALLVNQAQRAREHEVMVTNSTRSQP